jgi:predicted HTH domain antitoxin
MTVTIELPETTERMLEQAFGTDLNRAALEALAIEGYRTAKLSVGEVGLILDMGTIEAQAWLIKRGVPMNYSLDDLTADRKTLSGLFPEISS